MCVCKKRVIVTVVLLRMLLSWFRHCGVVWGQSWNGVEPGGV